MLNEYSGNIRVWYFPDYFNWTLADYDNTPKLLVPGGLHISDEDDSETVGNLIKDEYTSGQSFYEDVLGGIKVSVCKF